MDHKELLLRDQNDTSLSDWRVKEKIALELLQVVGGLRFDKDIELMLFRRSIYDCCPSEVLNNHKHSKNYVDEPIQIQTSLAIAKSIANIENIGSARIDLGKLVTEWDTQKADYTSIDDFVHKKLTNLIGVQADQEGKDVILYGFGRIGRLAARRIINLTGKGQQLRLKAIVIRPKMKDRKVEAEKRASLLRSDSVHGEFRGTIDVSDDGNELIVNGNRIRLIFAKSPSEVDYTVYGINNALLIDNTGVWRNKEELSIHLRPGVSQVMLTAPAGDIPNIVHGVNQNDLDVEKTPIFCAASCTTNAIVPIIKVVDEKYGIERGHIETIHAYTNDQNLLDNFHKKPRRGRGAATNMVLTTTGAAKAVAKVLPHLAGKLSGNAVRVPTPDVSLAIMSLTLKNKTTREELISLLREACFHGNLVEQIHFSNSTEYVSSNAVGMTTTSVLDAPSTIVDDNGMNVTIYAWYDNEFGYTCQVVRLAKHASNVRRYAYY